MAKLKTPRRINMRRKFIDTLPFLLLHSFTNLHNRNQIQNETNLCLLYDLILNRRRTIAYGLDGCFSVRLLRDIYTEIDRYPLPLYRSTCTTLCTIAYSVPRPSKQVCRQAPQPLETYLCFRASGDKAKDQKKNRFYYIHLRKCTNIRTFSLLVAWERSAARNKL